MQPARKPWWQQATALVSLGAGGTITGFSFAPGTAASIASPASIPVHLTALEKAAQPAAADDAMLRSAIVNVTNYYLQMAKTKSPAEMEAIIWQHDSVDGVDHGQSCAAFASMTLELAAQVVGQQSWVTGGGSYPWPLHQWADVRVDPNPASLGITSVLQDAQAHGRWHPLGDSYQPQPGDWVLFDGHIEVVTSYTSGVLHTVGGDSLPNFSVNAHEFSDPLSAQGVAGFVNNGSLAASAATTPPTSRETSATAGPQAARPPVQRQAAAAASNSQGQADIPGATAAGSSAPTAAAGSSGPAPATGSAAPMTSAASSQPAAASQGQDAAIPGMPMPTASLGGNGAPSGRHAARHTAAPSTAAQATAAQGTAGQNAAQGTAAQNAAAIPGVPTASPTHTAPPAQAPAPQQAAASPAPSAAPYHRHPSASPSATAQGTSSQQAFIDAVAPGAAAAQRRYGVPAAVTIAQAIDESGWGQSQLASKDNNLFGIKGTGPAGSDPLPTQEYLNGQWVSQTASFRIYNSVAESINDHGKLLATSGYYGQAMASRNDPNAFANALTGIYATDPGYGQTLIGLMNRYNLSRYDSASAAASGPATPSAAPTGTPRTTPPAATAPATAPQTTPAATPAPSTPAATPTPTTPAASPTSTTPVTAVAGAHADIPGIAAPATTATTPAASPATTPAASPATTPAPAPLTTPATPVTTPAAPRGTPTAPKTTAPTPQATRPIPQAIRAMPQATPSTPQAAPTNSQTPSAAPAGTTPAAHPTASAPATRKVVPSVTPRSTPAATPRQRATATPVMSAPATAPRTAPAAAPRAAARGSASIPGVPNAPAPSVATTPAGPASSSSPGPSSVPAPSASAAPSASQAPDNLSAVRRPVRQGAASTQTVTARLMSMTTGNPPRRNAPHNTRGHTTRYKHHVPQAVMNAFMTTARVPLIRTGPLYRDVASDSGIRWELLAACDWMQCKAHPRYSPVQGEKLRTVNPDGTVYRTRSEALAQCANDLAEFSAAVYQIDLTADEHLSVRDLANVFAAFRWGALLRLHHTSALEFPYSVAGLTAQHMNMRWPDIDEPNAPDKPGARFRRPFGAVPIVLGLGYPATV